jgi:hypothetical protein
MQHEEHDMPRIEMDLETAIAPERLTAALLDFSDRRPEIWPGIEPSLYRVYSVAEVSADVQEGSKIGGTQIWARERYDWSTPGLVIWTVQESNFCEPGSFVSAAISPRDGGGSRVHITWSRTFGSLAWRLMALLFVVTRGAPIKASFRMGLARIEQEPATAAA